MKKAPHTSIRAILPEDTAIFRELRLSALKDSPLSFGQIYEEEIEKPISYWQSLTDSLCLPSEHRGFLLFAQSKPIGIIMGFKREENKSSFGGLWVAPEYRGFGLGSQLVQSVLDWANQKGFSKIRLWNVDGNEAAIKLYEKFGFQPTGKQQPLPSHPEYLISEFEKTTKGT